MPPHQCDVLLYFKTGADAIAPYFSKSKFQIMDLRESEVNLSIIFKCLATRDLSAQNYARQFIKVSRPKLVLTFIDNFPPFYLIKTEFPKIQTLLIQNGYRSDRGDLFGLLASEYSKQKNKVDNLFVFGNAVGTKYLDHISGAVVAHGSFKNNSIPITASKNNSIAYISTYRPSVLRSFVVPESTPDLPITYGEIIARRELVISWLATYCQENSRPLRIIGKDENPKLEESYYRQLLSRQKFEFVGKQTYKTSYEALDQSEIIVFTSSSLGYEALARGKKTAAIMLDAEIVKADALKFGWPANLADDGMFWTNHLSKERLYDILNFLGTVDDPTWNQVRLDAIKNIIDFDPDNSKFTALVNSFNLARK